MTKIGIITYHNTTNYGALLQNFALQSKFKELGADCETISYHCKSIEDREGVTFPKLQKDLLRYMKQVKKFFAVQKKKKIMNSFVKKNMSISKNEYSRSDIEKCNELYDKFVVGSDMVFELGINGGDMTYYLDFADTSKRYSYAASLAVDKIDEKYLDKCKEELEKFQCVSIREKQGQEYFSKILKKKVQIDVDPTLLYDGDFWEKYEEIPKEVPQTKYMLLYFLNKNMPEFEVARKIAKEKDLEIILLSNNKVNIDGCKVISDASVGEFLYYIHHAALVITASFHGMIFSMNYNTNFMYFCHNKSASRLDNIAKITMSTDRELKDDYIPSFDCNFKNINKAVREVREKSINYLKNIVGITNDCKNVSVIKKEDCCGCSGCKAVCPKKAIYMEEDAEGFLYPKVNDKCINCSLCLKVCKNKNNIKNNDKCVKVYAAKNKNDDVLKKSSSGGISRSLCEYFIKRNGVVYGVVYNEKKEVVVERETSLTETEKLYGSKYVWANPGDTFEQVYNDLRDNKDVLFIATSCFVAGLKSFLEAKRCNIDKLFTVDLICHGTPSPRLFRDYIEYLKNKYDFENFEFRTKTKPWGYGSKSFGCTIFKKDGTAIIDTIDARLYLKIFFSNYALRPHCHRCEYASTNKPSDITIADYWGLKDEHPDFFDEKGVSAIITHTKKGDEIFKSLKDITYINSTIEKVSKKQTNLNHPSLIKEDRNVFWNLYYEKGFKAVCKKYANLDLKSIIKSKIKKIIKK